VAGLLVLLKLPMALPALALVVVADDRVMAGVVGLAVALTLGALTFLVGGSNVWTDLVVAQWESGARTLHDLGGYWVQALWNLFGLLVLGAFAWRQWRLSVVAAAALLTVATTAKIGTGLNVIVVAEAALVPLAVVGALALWARRDWLRWLPVAAGLMLAVQTVSLVTGPEQPGLFLRPGSTNAWARVSARTVRALEVSYSHCTSVVGPPLPAFAEHKEIAGGQPDAFLIDHSATLRRRYGATIVASCHG
jgi:hypothetical protein